MTLEEIRKNAPEGATHYYICEDGDVIYYIYKNRSLMWHNNGRWGYVFDPQEPCDLSDSLKPL